jgi:hypothetical protein
VKGLFTSSAGIHSSPERSAACLSGRFAEVARGLYVTARAQLAPGCLTEQKTRTLGRWVMRLIDSRDEPVGDLSTVRIVLAIDLPQMVFLR